MDEQAFRKWLGEKFKKSVAQSRFTNCKKVESNEGDLDRHFDTDKGSNLLELLTYSTDDQLNNRLPRHSIIIDGNIRTGTATLKQAVNLYFKFRNGDIPEVISNDSVTS